MRKDLPLWLAALGILFLLPIIWRWISAPLKLGKEQVAFANFARASLRDVTPQRAVDLSVTIPDNALWKKIIREWGDPGYLIAAVSPERKLMYCFDRIGLSIQAAIHGKRILLEPASEPLYGYSTECEADGLKFRVRPGTTVNIHVSANGSRDTPPGDLIVTGYWTAKTKDHLVGLAIDRELRPLQNLSAIGGAAMLAFAAWLFVRRRGYPRIADI